MDFDLPQELQDGVQEALNVGAQMLLPSLQEKIELLHALLPQGADTWDSLTRGEVNNFRKLNSISKQRYFFLKDSKSSDVSSLFLANATQHDADKPPKQRSRLAPARLRSFR